MYNLCALHFIFCNHCFILTIWLSDILLILSPEAALNTLCQTLYHHSTRLRAGHLRYFLIFSIIKNDLYIFPIKLIIYFCTSPIYKARSQSNLLTEKCKKSFFIVEKIVKKWTTCIVWVPSPKALALAGNKLEGEVEPPLQKAQQVSKVACVCVFVCVCVW